MNVDFEWSQTSPPLNLPDIINGQDSFYVTDFTLFPEYDSICVVMVLDLKLWMEFATLFSIVLNFVELENF